jgi:hypothetical protein
VHPYVMPVFVQSRPPWEFVQTRPESGYVHTVPQVITTGTFDGLVYTQAD